MSPPPLAVLIHSIPMPFGPGVDLHLALWMNSLISCRLDSSKEVSSSAIEQFSSQITSLLWLWISVHLTGGASLPPSVLLIVQKP